MNRTIIDVFAEVIASRDGFYAHEVAPSYYVEARELVLDLNKKGLDIVRVKDDG